MQIYPKLISGCYPNYGFTYHYYRFNVVAIL